MTLFGICLAWPRQRKLPHALSCRAPCLVIVICLAGGLHAGCRGPDRDPQPVATQPAVDWHEARSVRTAVEEMVAPVRLGMSEAELRDAGCVKDREGEHPFLIMTTPSQLDPGLEIRTSSGAEISVALGSETRCVKVVYMNDRSFVFFGRIHVGSTYAELAARLSELGVPYRGPFPRKLSGQVVFAYPGLEFYFARPELKADGASSTRPVTREEALAAHRSRIEKLVRDELEGRGVQEARPPELPADAPITGISFREVSQRPADTAPATEVRQEP
jgi:hypothetical protein